MVALSTSLKVEPTLFLGTKDENKMPIDFPEIQTASVECVQPARELCNIPQEYVVNMDQIGCHLLPGGHWTMEEQESKQFTIIGLDDKRQITVWKFDRTTTDLHLQDCHLCMQLNTG